MVPFKQALRNIIDSVNKEPTPLGDDDDEDSYTKDIMFLEE